MEFAELLAHKYHFGREHEASIQLLFRSFCNNLYIGQFELARASIKELHQQRSFLKYHVKDVFSKALDRWCTSENPLHPLTWPCFLEYKLIEDNATKVEEVTKALEFHFLLADVCQDAESSLIKDIYAFYAQETSELSSPCQAFLVSILVKKPTPATLLLDYLPLKNVTFQMNNVTLDAIDRCITEKNQSSLRELLARGKLELNVDGAKDRLEVILAKAFADCLLTGGDERWLSYEDIMTASASRSDLGVYTLAQTLHMDSLEDSDKQAYKWRDMALNILTSQTHFFDTLLTHSDKFMKEHRYQDLVAMFDTPEWRPLFPFVFHRAWRLCSNTEQSHQVIAAFSQVEDKKLAALINEHQRIDIIEQSLDLSSTTSRTPSSMKSGDLSVFKSHSVLHALYICLSNLDSWSHQKMMKTLTAESAYALLDQYELGMSGSNSLSIKQQRDIHLFNAFTIIDSFMQALCKASENISGVAFSQRYAGDVVPLLVTLRNLLVDLRPLTLKLEVIEDLFLLLFAMSQDIKTSSQHARADMAQSMGQEKSSYAEMSEDDPECYHSAREWVSTSKPTKHNSSRSKTDYLKVPKSKIQSSRTERSSDENPNTDGIQTTAVGFIANEFITRDILTIIKTALTDVTASSFEIRNNLIEKRLEDELRQVILSSISENNFMSRLSQLQQRVSEALWRYQLLLQDSVVKEFGSVTLRPTTDTGVHNDDGYGVFERSLPNMTASKSSLGVQRSGEASQESELSSEILTYSSGTNTPAALSKNKRYRKRMASQKSALSLPSMEGLIPKMLASPISLLNICINRGNDTQARQVLKLYNLEESVEGRQFSFAQSHKQFLFEQGKQQRSSKSVAKKSSTQPVENLSFMRSMAAKSLTTMDDSLKAETLALAATLPRTQGGLQVDKFLGANARDSQVATSMVLADLACANADCFQRSHHLLTTAWKYSTSSSRSTSGLQSWIKKCLSLNEFAVSLDLSKLLSLLLDEEMHSLQSCLLSTLFTMDTGELSEKIVSLMELCKEVKVVEQAIGHYLKIPAKERSQTLELTPVLRILSKHFPGSRQYLSILSDQLILLQKTIKDNALPPSGVAAVLYDGPTMTMGRLMFEHNIEPARLASVAEQVKLDLTHVIVRSCCPPVRCKPFEEDAHAIEGIQESLVADKKFGYRRVLNQSHVHAVDFFLPPLVTVSNALTSLLKLLNGTLVMNNKKRLDRCLAIKIKETEAYSLFCDECRQLQSVDLKLLTTNQQKLAFFINLHNMLSLHGVVETMVTQRRAQRMLDSMSTAAAFHMRVSYIVGQLGLCSVFELQQFFLRVNVVKHMDMCIDHPWACYAPEPNPLTVFALYDGRLNVLPLKCTSAETVDNEISDSVTMYMRRAVIISPHSLEIHIPDQLLRVRKELVIEVETGLPRYEHAAVLLWILDYQPTTRWSEMKLILDKLEHKRGNPQVTKSEEGTEGTAPSLSSMESSQEASVLIVPAHNRLGFSLDPQTTTLEDGEETEVPEEDTGCSLSISDSILQDAKFKISDVAVQYLREQSPVVAMLLDIIYDDMCFNGDGGKHFSSEILRKEYPHLQRYLMQFIAPLCVHIYEEVNDIDQLARIELPEYIKSAILTHKSCLHLEHAASRCLDALIKDDKYHEVVDVIHRLTALTGDSCSDWLAIRDYALIKNASEQVSTEALNCIKCLRCERLQANIVILSLHKSLLTAEKCLQLLPLCEKRLLDKGDNSLVLYLNNLHTKMSAYHRIMLHAQAKREMTIEGCPAKIISALASAWQSVGVMLSEHPREVAHLLFDAEEFQFAKKLIDIQEKEDKDLRLLVYKRYIVNFLDSNPANIDEITSVLRGSVEDDVHWCFSLCMQVLQALKNPSSMLVIISFMSRNMADSLGDKQKENLDLGHLGVQMLLELDQAVHPQYRQLMFQPLLIFEQLLMNAKISWAARVAPLLLKTRGKTHFTEEINTLLVTYAEKAINFPLLRVTEDKDGAATSISPNVKAVRKLEVVGSPSKASLAQRALLGSSLRKSSSQQSLAPRLSRTTTAPGELAAMAVTRTPDSLSPTTTTTPEKVKYGALPEKAPTKEEWVPNDQALVCMRCQVETFSMFTRRHHCRRCGLVVCATCSSRTAPIGGRSVRVCEHCYEYMFRQRGNTSPSSQSRKSKEKPSASPTLSPTSSPRTTLQMPLSQGNPEAPEWLLGISETENEELRSDFFYDHAPSVSLCTSILQLYTGGIACGRYMLRLCEKLSHIIKPIEQRSTNQEVDYNLIISMMKFLLLNAKLRFVKEHYIDGVGLCESYTNRVEVLSLLISDYYVNLPTVEDLAKIDNVRRLRDKLMEDERPELAMEISTRFGLETTAIWSAWGLTCLRKGDYKAARDKFSKFLKPLKDKSSQTIAFGTILNDILNTLLGQTAVGPCSYTQLSIKNTLKALTSGQDISKSIPLLPTHGSKIDANLENVEECLYYLNTFANHQKVIEFYADNGYLLKAIQYCIDKNCSTDVFIECIFQPAVARGELSFLQEQLLTVDSGLQSCNSYLTAVCRHLARYNKYHVLYQMQVFIKDHLRAAMTCIQAFYLNKAKSYGDLNNRNQHLSKALEHYQSYLGPPRPERASRLKRAQLSGTGQNSELSGRLKLPESEVRRLVSLVKLQIDVAKHMSSSSLAKGPVLSLFGEQQERTSLASLVIITGKSVSVGFELAFRIIQDCQLSYNQVYTHAARRFSEIEAYTSLRALLTCIKDSGLCDAALLDRVLLSGIQAAKPDALNSNEIEGLIKLLNADSSKIDAYIMCGKLRNAYLLAIRSDSVETVMKISQEAVRLNQPAVKNICDKYLKQKQVG